MYPEVYDFSASYFTNRESFLMGSKAKVIIHPRLTINGEPAPLNIIEELEIVGSSYTEDNIPSTVRLVK